MARPYVPGVLSRLVYGKILYTYEYNLPLAKFELRTSRFAVQIVFIGQMLSTLINDYVSLFRRVDINVLHV